MKGKTDLAIATYRTVIDRDATHVTARIALARSLARVPRRPEAIEAMNEVLALDPANGRAHERLAIWHYYEGDLETAWRHVHAARDVDQALPPQFIVLLERKMTDPGRRTN